MRKMIFTAIAAGVLMTAAVAQAETPTRHRAVAAENYAVQASYSAPAQREWGYSASTRRIADCLATYPGYDPKIDRVRTERGRTRACRL